MQQTRNASEEEAWMEPLQVRVSQLCIYMLAFFQFVCLALGLTHHVCRHSGGENLAEDRYKLPKIDGVRCPTGDAKLTGPGDYGSLGVPFVIHAGTNMNPFIHNSHISLALPWSTDFLIICCETT